MRLRAIVAVTACAVAGALAVSATASGQIFISNCGSATVRPHHLTLTCADAGLQLIRLHWTHWGGAHATARGTLARNTCDPSCAAGRFRYFPVSVTAVARGTCPGHGRRRFYHRIRWRGRANGSFRIACF